MVPAFSGDVVVGGDAAASDCDCDGVGSSEVDPGVEGPGSEFSGISGWTFLDPKTVKPVNDGPDDLVPESE
ncbi:hypothetical protein GOEFS_091_00490 [Gordonia effusa NBRC 100432]|uniref:Uncharacterized protein n=1 Tax=Gordonia effusa NBRC 100432 TaxID=1077974 RepID=H0R3A5_9ACTN|nr:hypothetical protein GOEFS_091_00490 [Gordonia effusa NBRC 100432]